MDEVSSEIRFLNCCLLPGRRQLLVDGQPARLGARGFDVLLALVRRCERPVGKQELLDEAWPGLVVEENNLQVQISALRKLLGPDVIVTIPGRGYQFAAALDGGDAAVAARPASAPRAQAAADAPLYGRAEDLDAVDALLREHRLVSVVGPGGIGKTVLARAALERPGRSAGWWVELAPLSDALQVAGALARALGVAVGAERTELQAVTGVLSERDGLVVLDNAEHVLDGVAAVVDALMREAPGIRMLVTSQEPLRSPGEFVYRLGPLALDAQGADGETARPGGAVELFVARARAANPRLVFDAPMLQAARDICRQLDGIPLAIELAAARVPLLGVDGLRARLGERLQILTAGARTVLRRHQTLRAALEWSHGLLAPEEQTVFRRLGVFAGGFPLEYAQDVVADARIDRWAVLDLLGHLVDKSLVVAEGAGLPRYRLLETNRAYAIEQLAAAGETAALLARHASALAAMLRPFDAARWTMAADWRVRAGLELDNLRAALDWLRRSDNAAAWELAGWSMPVWIANGQQNEGVRTLLELMPRPPGVDDACAARVDLTLARLGYIGAGRACFEAACRAADAFRRAGDRSHLLDALNSIAQIGSRLGEDRRVEDAIAEVGAIMPPDAPPRQRAASALSEALWHLMTGNHALALESAERQGAIYRANGDGFGVELAESNAAFYQAAGGDFTPAVERLYRAVDGLRRMDAPYGVGGALGFLCVIHALRGESDEALRCGRESIPHLRRNGWLTWMLQGMALAHAQRGALVRAAQILGHVDAEFDRLGFVRRPVERRVHEAAVRLIRAGPGVSFEAHARLGAALSEERAVALAIEGAPAAP